MLCNCLKHAGHNQEFPSLLSFGFTIYLLDHQCMLGSWADLMWKPAERMSVHVQSPINLLGEAARTEQPNQKQSIDIANIRWLPKLDCIIAMKNADCHKRFSVGKRQYGASEESP